MPSGHILYVDDDLEYHNSLGDSLRCAGFEVDMVTTKDAAVRALEAASYDLLLVNMHLGPMHDYVGEGILSYALEHFPPVPRVLITGQEAVPSFGTEEIKGLEEMFSRFKLAEFCRKSPELDAKKLSTRIGQIIAQGGSAFPLDQRREVFGRPYEIRAGANWDILSFLGTCNVLPDMFKDIPNYLDYLYILLSGPQPDQRYVATEHLWKGLWVQEGGLPYFDMIGLLTSREADGTLYTGYRDHVVHSLLTYLLGLCLYYGNRRLRTAIGKEFSNHSDFLAAWKIAALFHDIGYMWNAVPEQRREIEKYFLDKVQAYFKYPLHYYCAARSLTLSKRDEERLRLQTQAYVREVSTLAALRMSMSEEYPLNQLDDLVVETHLVTAGSTGILQRYDSFSKVTPPNGMAFPIEDHGILSALLLLCQTEYFERYTQSVCPAGAVDLKLPDMTRECISLLPLQTRRRTSVIQQAAAAIALHNINKDIWDHDDAKEDPYCLTLTSYQLDLEHTPLAYLLALVDVLQCWDRPKRTHIPKTFQDCTWQSEDVRILCRDNRIEVCFLQDPVHRRCTADSVMTNLLAEMSHYLRADDLSMIVEIKAP